MNCDIWIEQLYNDEGLTADLGPDDLERLQSWSESRLAACDSEVEAVRLIDSIRLLNRYVKEGEPFDDLFTALRANFMRTVIDSEVPLHPELPDPELESIYPQDPAPEE
jgi:hypothetical protein